MTQYSETVPVITAVTGAVMVITLDRPQALNALDLPMARRLFADLTLAARAPAITCVILQATGGRAFCAGGDVRRLVQSFGTAGDLSQSFFRAEYALNRLIHRFPKPFISLIDGIAMGGGVGLSIHGSVRIVTDRVRFAMPETLLGLFPDVGASWFLPRMPGALGIYLGLTGAHLAAADSRMVGYATHTVAHPDMPALLAALLQAQPADLAAIDRVVAPFSTDPGPAPLAAHRALIDRCFGHDSVAAIIAALAGEASSFASETLRGLALCSPTSLQLTLALLQQGRSFTIEQALQMEFRVGQRVMAGHDFREGVRARLIDKDNQPRWRPGSLAEVTAAEIEACFAPLSDRAELGWVVAEDGRH